MSTSPLIYNDAYLKDILKGVKTVAMIGASPNWVRPSNFVVKYLLSKDYIIHPINPGHAGKEIWGQTVYASLDDVPAPIDMVDVFRNVEAVPGILDDVLRLKDEKGIKVLWLQLGIIHEEAAATAEAAGIQVVMDRCPKIEYGRLFGELSWSGIDSGIISSKRRRA